jgi:hypothetical protein
VAVSSGSRCAPGGASRNEVVWCCLPATTSQSVAVEAIHDLSVVDLVLSEKLDLECARS